MPLQARRLWHPHGCKVFEFGCIVERGGCLRHPPLVCRPETPALTSETFGSAGCISQQSSCNTTLTIRRGRAVDRIKNIRSTYCRSLDREKQQSMRHKNGAELRRTRQSKWAVHGRAGWPTLLGTFAKAAARSPPKTGLHKTNSFVQRNLVCTNQVRFEAHRTNE